MADVHKNDALKYLVVGAGGVGGTLAFHLAASGCDVTVIARGDHGRAIAEEGLILTRPDGTEERAAVKQAETETYDGVPDVIFVCVKGYSLPALIPFLDRVSNENTVIIPLLNIYGTGGHIREALEARRKGGSAEASEARQTGGSENSEAWQTGGSETLEARRTDSKAEAALPLVTDGCIYVSAKISAPGHILMDSNILRVIFGVRDPADARPVLERVKADLERAGARAILSDDIARDALRKFSYVSPVGAAGVYFDVPAREMQKEGESRDVFISLVREVMAVGEAMGHALPSDMVEKNLRILDAVAPEATTSMQRDIARGGLSEADGLVYEMVRLGEKLRVKVPFYDKIAEEFRRRGILPGESESKECWQDICI